MEEPRRPVDSINEIVTRIAQWQKREQDLRKNNPFLSKFDAMYLAALQRPEELVEAFEHLIEEQRFDEQIQELQQAAQNLPDRGQAANLDAQLEHLQDINVVLNRRREELHQLQELIDNVHGAESFERAQRHRDAVLNRTSRRSTASNNSVPCQHCGRRYSQTTISRHVRSCEPATVDGSRMVNRSQPYSLRRSSRATATATQTKNI